MNQAIRGSAKTVKTKNDPRQRVKSGTNLSFCPHYSRLGADYTRGGTGLGTAYSVDVSGQNIKVGVVPETRYCAPALCLHGDFGVIQVFADPEHMAMIEYAVKTYLDSIRYPETPDQQALNHEKNQSEEEIA